MIMDGQNYFSDLASGDKPRTSGVDTASASVIDQQGINSIFSEGGGANIPLILKAVVTTAFTSAGSTATVAVVLQDSADNVTYADVLVGKANLVTALVAGFDGFAGQRIAQSLRRYVRVVYRVAVQDVTAGTLVVFLTPEQDLFDLSQRQATGTIAAPTGAADESVANGVLNS